MKIVDIGSTIIGIGQLNSSSGGNAMRKNLKIHFAVDAVTNKKLLSESKKSGLPKSELVRFAVETMFNPEWKKLDDEFHRRLDEMFCFQTGRGGSSERP